MRFPRGAQPARTRRQRTAEEALYSKLVAALRKLTADAIRLVKGEPVKAKGWSASEQYWMDQIIQRYLTETLGSPRAATDPVEYVGNRDSGALQEAQWLTYRSGIDWGAERAGQSSPAIEQEALARNQAAFLQDRFAKLSERGFGCLRDVLDRPGDVQAWVDGGMGNGAPGLTQIIEYSIGAGENPVQTERWMSQASDNYERWKMAQLARTETMIALNTAARDELAAGGYTELDGVKYPPYHPNCRCSTTIDQDAGYMMPDVAETACWICQDALVAAEVANDAARTQPGAQTTGE